MVLDDLDLNDPQLFADERHHAAFTELREVDPVHWQERRDGGPGFWNLTLHADVVAANRDTERFISSRGVTLAPPTDPPTEMADGGALLPILDAPVHTRQRRTISRGFTPRAVAALEAQLADRARRIVDAVAAQGRCDFVADIATVLPLAAISDLVGIPDEDHERVVRWGNQVLGFDDPEYAGGAGQLETMVEMIDYAAELRRARMADPRDDLATRLSTTEVDGEMLSDVEFGQLFFLLAVAGNETTRNAAAHGVRALAAHPDQLAALRDDPTPTRLERAVEEVLRWSTPVLHFGRTTSCEVELGGRTIGAGERVVLWYASANRDEAVFDDPFRFDIDRHPNDHVSFGGGGPHFCLGASLARLELRVLLAEVATRLPDLTLAGPPELLRSTFVSGVKRLPVRWRVS
jgi:cholest-4-en-3-one 26-monooxygenase